MAIHGVAIEDLVPELVASYKCDELVRLVELHAFLTS
jgi:uncharacterized protein (DUF2132 family)